MQINPMREPQVRTTQGLGRRLGRRDGRGFQRKGIFESAATGFDEAPLDGIETPCGEKSRRIRRHIDGGTNLVVHRGPLIDVDNVAGPAEGDGGG